MPGKEVADADRNWKGYWWGHAILMAIAEHDFLWPRTKEKKEDFERIFAKE